MRAVDLFAGAGGSSLGAELAGLEVIAAVNHWPIAVESHAAKRAGLPALRLGSPGLGAGRPRASPTYHRSYDMATTKTAKKSTKTAAKKTSAKTSAKMVGSYVVVRTYSAGVHVGVLERRAGRDVTLRDARRIWRWHGANTLHEISLHGIDSNSKVSETVARIELTEAIEVIPCTPDAEKNLRSAVWSS